MRLRTFTARTMPEAMALVREQLGGEAIILSTARANGGISVTAALDQADLAVADVAAAEPTEDPLDILHEMLTAHGTPAPLVERLLSAILESAAAEPTPALAAASDVIRAGGVAQLESFTCMLGLELQRAESARELAELTAGADQDAVILIDSGGINPYSASDRSELAAYLVAARAEPVLVLPAGGDVFDSIEIACAFASLGSTRLLTTRLDMVHRLGSQLAAADAAQLSFCDASMTPDIAQGLFPLNPVALALLIMPETPQADVQRIPERAR